MAICKKGGKAFNKSAPFLRVLHSAYLLMTERAKILERGHSHILGIELTTMSDKSVDTLGSKSLRLRQIIDLLATDKSRCFAQPRPIIIK